MKPKVLVLLSGGLDSRLAVKIMKEQLGKARVEAVHFKLPFENCCLPGCAFSFAQKEGIKLHVFDLTKGRLFVEFINLIRRPKHGYGSGMNPCIDCHIFMLKKAKALAEKIGAEVVVTGEVLDERPMSQRLGMLELIEGESGLKGKLLRPLSAKLLKETKIEKEGKIDRERLFGIKGRSRKIQLELAKKFRLEKFPMPGGGCLLCEKEFAKKLRDLFKNQGKVSEKDIELLKVGRHFRAFGEKIVVGRNKGENEVIRGLQDLKSLIFEAAEVVGPTTILKGRTREGIEAAAKLTARYCDASGRRVKVKYSLGSPIKEIVVSKATKKEIEDWRI